MNDADAEQDSLFFSAGSGLSALWCSVRRTVAAVLAVLVAVAAVLAGPACVWAQPLSKPEGAPVSSVSSVSSIASVAPGTPGTPGTNSKAFNAKPTLQEMLGQMLLVGFRGLEAGEDSAIMRDVRRYHLGGVLLFDYDVALQSRGRNIASPEQVRSLVSGLQAAARVPLFVAIDQEGGRVARLKPEYGFAASPSAAQLGNGTVEGTRRAGEAVGRMLADVGVNWNYAPVLDVNVNPDSPAIGRLGRSFSADPATVAAHGRAFAEGLNAHGVIACLKHFPGHGSAGADSHLGVTDVTGTWSQRELVPFETVLRAPLQRAVMTGHLFNARLDPDYPATLSRSTITGLLRERMGYDGVVITDDMQMRAIADEYGLEEAVERAVAAGADILLFGNNLAYDEDIVPKVVRILARLVEDNRIPRTRVERSYRRVMELKRALPR